MRAVSLSNTQVITLLNRYFVPVFLSNEDYRDAGRAAPEEKAELRRIHREGHAARLSVGSVHAFILAPDGRVVDSLHTVEAAKPDRLIALLERSVQRFGTVAGGPVLQPGPLAAPKSPPDALRLHLTARYLERRGNTFALTGQEEDAGGGWGSLPSEDWIALSRTEWTKLLPPGEAAAGRSWEIDAEVATKLLTHFYPPTENWDTATHRIERKSLRGTVVSVTGGVALARLDGGLRMKHSFYHKEDGGFLEARVVGYLEFEPEQRRIRSLRLVTDEATYYREGRTAMPFGVAVRSVPG